MGKNVEIDLREVSKRFLCRYFPIFALFALAEISITQSMGYYPIESSIPQAFIMFNIRSLLQFVSVLCVLYLFKLTNFYSRLIFGYMGVILGTFVFISMIIALAIAFPDNSPLIANHSLDYSVIKQSSLYDLYHSSIFFFYFFVSEQSYISDKKFQDEQLKRLSNEKKVVESNLKLLQAQIEPHFLFNTLTAVVSLYDRDIKKGKAMLLNFIQYLRASLIRSRSRENTIDQEIKLINAYLDIFQIRMGKRLSYAIDVPEEMKRLKFPTMLIQPLVENAIVHGLEPGVDGGRLSVKLRKENGKLRWEVADTGLGFRDNGNAGVGLSIIEERIDSLFGSEGKLYFEENQPTGIKAIVEAPCG